MTRAGSQLSLRARSSCRDNAPQAHIVRVSDGQSHVDFPLRLFNVTKPRELFELMCANDLEGMVAKRLGDLYELRVKWLKIKNGDYSQTERRDDLFNRRRQRPAHSAG
jgi:hypothetical protein